MSDRTATSERTDDHTRDIAPADRAQVEDLTSAARDASLELAQLSRADKDHALRALADAIDARLSAIGAFDLRVGAPRATDNAVDCTAEPSPEWDALVAAVRGAAVEAFPEDELPAGPHAPHVALAYAVGEVPDAELEARLADAPEVGTVPIRGLHLVSVTMRPEVGTFDWTELANWEF